MAGRADILMYHSISDAGGPTSVAPDVFAAQMEALAASGLPVLAMDALPLHLASGQGRAVAITFDDGFADFAETAWPLICRHGFPAMVYLPADRMGGVEDWAGVRPPPRRLMDWDTVRRLAAEGVDFGNHTASHADLARLTPAEAAAELDRASARIEAELGLAPRHFAPPYGSTTAETRALIAARFDSSVGTRLGAARLASDHFDLPRLEMYYYTDLRHWRARLTGRGGTYMALRRAARRLRQLASGGIGAAAVRTAR